MPPPLEWMEGEEEVRRAVEAWWQAPDDAALDAREIADSKRRRVISIRANGGTGLIIKGFREKDGWEAWLSLAKRVLGQAPWQREQRGLQSVQMEPPLAPAFSGRARTHEGEVLLVSEFIEGPGLGDALRQGKADAPSTLRACGQVIARLHRAGIAHGDLHPGNLLLSAKGPVLIDFQRSSKNRPRSRTDDLARLDFSLALIDVPEPERHALISSALPDGTQKARSHRRVLRRSHQLAAQHRRIRMRHCLRPSPERATVRLGQNQRGLRRFDFTEENLRNLLEEHRKRATDGERTLPIQNDHGLFFIHEEQTRSLLGRIRQGVLGSPARRAWQRAHDPQRRGEDERILAFSEKRVLGFPVSSLWVSQIQDQQELQEPEAT